jgi:hypothetical protein
MLAIGWPAGYAPGVAKPKKRKNPIAVALAKMRAKKLSPERRREIAQQAAGARWAKPRKKGGG